MTEDPAPATDLRLPTAVGDDDNRLVRTLSSFAPSTSGEMTTAVSSSLDSGMLPRQDHHPLHGQMAARAGDLDLVITIPDDEDLAQDDDDDEKCPSPARQHPRASPRLQRQTSSISSLPSGAPATLTFHFAILVKLARAAPAAPIAPAMLESLHDLAKRLALAGFLVRLETRASYSKTSKPHMKLVFLLHAPDVILDDMQRKMEVERWVAGGRNAEHFLAPQHGPLTSADRIVLVDRLLHLPTRHGGLGLGDFDSLKVFPLHDDAFNREYVKQWVFQWRNYFRNNNDYIERTRLHFGEKAAIYFAYMDFYTKWLAPLALWGLFIYFLSVFSVPLYFQLSAVTGLAVSTLWGTLFLIFWKRRRSELRLKWGIGALEHVHGVNPTFRTPPRGASLNHIKWSRRLKYIVGYLVLVVFIVGETVLTIGFVDFYFFLKAGCAGHCATDGFENWILVLCQGILLGLVVDIIQYQIFRVIAVALTRWENHPTEKRYESSRALKVFLWDFFGIYSWFWMCAFVYIPYGSEFSSLLNEYNVLPWVSSYEPGLLELQTMFVTPLVVTQGLKIVFEKVIPYFLLQAGRRARESKGLFEVYHSTLAQGFNRVKARASTTTDTSPTKASRRVLIDLLTNLPTFSKKKLTASGAPSNQPPDHAAARATTTPAHRPSISHSTEAFQVQRQLFLDRVLEQANQSPHDTFSDYADTLVQFGYVSQFTCVWPFIPVCAVINNVFEVRSSAFQLAYASARVVPQRTSSIGSWNLFLRFNNIWAVFINVALICYASGLVESFFPDCVRQQKAIGYAQHLPPMVPNFTCLTSDTRFSIFLILEHVLVFVYVILTQSIHAVPSSIKRILKTKDKVLKEHFALHAARRTSFKMTQSAADDIAQHEATHEILSAQLDSLLSESSDATGLPRASTTPSATAPLPLGHQLGRRRSKKLCLIPPSSSPPPSSPPNKSL
ncbi:Aste57867_20081 [Aphanomyces stellatus]|uniref:Aste57867_20081 protein n=1 Tax=Aphanomyces stellatus TaxID=120398 RepID=A0A485LER3_9STRA|nr:hypothetical protein As57867_020015 [Aphanomyces stellatus]VFT96776.1 Aste57867_20081 [Aphanomyces stellatus]